MDSINENLHDVNSTRIGARDELLVTIAGQRVHQVETY